MRFMVIVYPGNVPGYEAGEMPGEELLTNMGKFNEELVDAGVMVSGEGLHPTAKGARVHFPGDGSANVTEGPFADSDRLVGGFWIWQVESKEEALSWARRAPMEDGATLELRQVFEMSDFGPEVEAQERALMEKMEEQQR